LQEELPAILRWLVEGNLKWQAEGLDEPNSVKMPTQEYRDSQDDLAEFLREYTVKEENARTSIRDLYRAYQDWFEGEKWDEMQKVPFGKALVSHGYISRKSHGVMVYLGIRLKTPEDIHADKGRALLVGAFPQGIDPDD
jgi:putative DNA primase/helicase